MINKKLLPKFNENIEIENLKIPQNCIVDMNKHLLARMRINGYGEIQVNHKNELVSGAEGLILAIEKGEKTINIIRLEPISLKLKK
jgi:hypothetical protein